MFKKNKNRKKRGFSEKLILLIIIWIITVFERALYYSFKNYSETIWLYIIPAIGTILGSSIGLHIWKTKSENILKISNNPNYDEDQLKEKLKQEVMNEFDYLDKHL